MIVDALAMIEPLRYAAHAEAILRQATDGLNAPHLTLKKKLASTMSRNTDIIAVAKMRVSATSFRPVQPSSLWFTCPHCHGRSPWHLQHTRKAYLHVESGHAFRYGLEKTTPSQASRCDICRRRSFFFCKTFCESVLFEFLKKEHSVAYEESGYLREGRIDFLATSRALQWCIIEQRTRQGSCLVHEIGPFCLDEIRGVGQSEQLAMAVSALNCEFDLINLVVTKAALSERRSNLSTVHRKAENPSSQNFEIIREIEAAGVAIAVGVAGVAAFVRNVVGIVKDSGDVAERQRTRITKRDE